MALNDREPEAQVQRDKARPWFSPILGDEQFWIPLVVLVGGLILLGYVQ
jgi:hypothetical protein